MRRFTVDQRRARLGVRHHLASNAKRTDVAKVAGDLIGLHGTDPASVFLAAAARLKKPTVESVERGALRRPHDRQDAGDAAHVVRRAGELVPVVQSAASVRSRRASDGARAGIESSGVAANGGRWLRRPSAATPKRSARTFWHRGALGKLVPLLREQITLARADGSDPERRSPGAARPRGRRPHRAGRPRGYVVSTSIGGSRSLHGSPTVSRGWT